MTSADEPGAAACGRAGHYCLRVLGRSIDGNIRLQQWSKQNYFGCPAAECPRPQRPVRRAPWTRASAGAVAIG